MTYIFFFMPNFQLRLCLIFKTNCIKFLGKSENYVLWENNWIVKKKSWINKKFKWKNAEIPGKILCLVHTIRRPVYMLPIFLTRLNKSLQRDGFFFLLFCTVYMDRTFAPRKKNWEIFWRHLLGNNLTIWKKDEKILKEIFAEMIFFF